MKKQMTIEQRDFAVGKTMGMIAFEQGYGPASALNPDAMDFIKGRPVGTNVSFLMGWANGWTIANLAAPLPELE